MSSQKPKINIYKLISSALSILLAGSIIILTMTALLLGFCRTDLALEKSLDAYQADFLEVFNDRMVQVTSDSDVPEEALINALSPEDMKIIVETIVLNIQYHYSTSFVGDEKVYSAFKTGLTNYVQANNLDISEKQISRYSALAVDVANEVFGGKSTSSVKIFTIAQDRRLMYVIIVFAVLIIGSIVALDLINYGRHRKYSFIGMGLTIAGYVTALTSAFIYNRGYIQEYRFCENSIYNTAIANLVSNMIILAVILGAAYLAAGVIMLVVNYRYFRKRKFQRDEQHKHNIDLRNEYMEQYLEVKGKSGKVDDGSVRVTGREEPKTIKFD